MTMLKTTLAALLVLPLAAPASAQDDPSYETGSVWQVEYIRTAPGQQGAYLDYLNRLWKLNVEAAQERGFILSYHVLVSQPANREDWDVMLLLESPNYAAFDVIADELAPISAAILAEGGDDLREAVEGRFALREALGSKLAEGVVFND